VRRWIFSAFLIPFFQALRHRNANVLPTDEDTADDLDNLDDLLQYIGHTSPECLLELGRPLNAIMSASHFLDPVLEKEMIAGNITYIWVNKDRLVLPGGFKASLILVYCIFGKRRH
jgi:hypothetical protein